MKLNSQGHILLISEPGFGIFSEEGYTRYTDVTDSPVWHGVYAADGSINVTILEDENTWTGLYATNGSYNVVEGAKFGVYSSCGAYNVAFMDEEEEV